MDYSRPHLSDRLAADYVLGTLRGAARRRFEALMPAHPALRSGVSDWQRRLGVLAADLAPVEPSAGVWPRIESRLFASTQAGATPSWWQRLGLWQGLAGSATVAALAFGIALQQPTPVQPPVVVVMDATEAQVAGVKAQFVASVSGDGRSLVLKPLGAARLSPQQALELWAVPPDGQPRSLGVVAGDRATTVLRTSLLKDTKAFAISLEPSGGSPTGLPTGPVLSVGALQL